MQPKKLTINIEELEALLADSERVGEVESLTLEGEINQLPSGIGQLKNLTKLYLRYNSIQIFPSQIGQLGSLKKLHLIGNDELQCLTNEIGRLNNLIHLDLYDNDLQCLPNGIEHLKNLEYLDLSVNGLQNLPSEIGQLKNLTELILHNNKLQSLPNEIGQLKNLTTLDLRYNFSLSENDFKKIEWLLPNTYIMSGYDR